MKKITLLPMHRLTYKLQTNTNVTWLLAALCGLSALGWLTHFTSPENYIYVGIFFLLLSFTIFSALYYISSQVRRCLLISIGVCIYLLLRMIGLTDFYYAALLGGCLISLELYFQKR